MPKDASLRLKIALALLRDTRLPHYQYAPPAYRLLWRLGLDIPPPHFMSFRALAWFHGAVFGVGMVLGWSLISALLMPDMPILLTLALGLVGGAIFGRLMAWHFVLGRALNGLPAWEDLESASGYMPALAVNPQSPGDRAGLLRDAALFLGVDRLASRAQVYRAWKRKLKKVHPDIGGTKEAAQHATRMRDILLAWIAAGRPDPAAAPNPATAARASAAPQAAPQGRGSFRPSSTQQPPMPRSGFATVVAVATCGLSVLLLILSIVLRKPPRTHMYGLPVCTGMDTIAETEAMLKGKCWPAQRR